MEAVDLEDAVSTSPVGASFFATAPGRNTYLVAIDSDVPGIEISEAVAVNESGIVDEGGVAEDWVEIRNTSADPIGLDGIELTQSLFELDPKDVYHFPEGEVLQPGEYLIVYLDNDLEEGVFHAPFR